MNMPLIALALGSALISWVVLSITSRRAQISNLRLDLARLKLALAHRAVDEEVQDDPRIKQTFLMITTIGEYADRLSPATVAYFVSRKKLRRRDATCSAHSSVARRLSKNATRLLQKRVEDYICLEMGGYCTLPIALRLFGSQSDSHRGNHHNGSRSMATQCIDPIVRTHEEHELVGCPNGAF